MKSQVLTAISCFYLIPDIALKVNTQGEAQAIIGQILVAYIKHIASHLVGMATSLSRLI